MSPNIDLTANRDFGGGNIDLFDDVIMTTYMGARMTPAEYDSLKKHEKFFGNDIHITQSDRLFLSVKEDKYMAHVDSHCHRCGKELHFPWKKFYGLCEECNFLCENNWNEIPWRKKSESPNSIARDLLSMR